MDATNSNMNMTTVSNFNTRSGSCLILRFSYSDIYKAKTCSLSDFGEFCNALSVVKQLCIQIIILSIPTGADQSRIMQEQMSGAAMAMPADTNKAFKVKTVVSA